LIKDSDPIFFLTLSAIRILQFYRLICSHTRYTLPVPLAWSGAYPATLPYSIHATRPLAKLSQVFCFCAFGVAAPLAGSWGLRFYFDGDASFLGWRSGRVKFGNPCGEYGWIQTTVHLLFHAEVLTGISGWCVYSFWLHIPIIHIHTSKSVWWQLCKWAICYRRSGMTSDLRAMDWIIFYELCLLLHNRIIDLYIIKK
jgi:hypothetical protein